MLYGELKNIKQSYIKQLNELFEIDIDKQELCPIGLINSCCFLSCALNKSIMICVSHEGSLCDVVFGKYNYMPKIDEKFRIINITPFGTTSNVNAYLVNVNCECTINVYIDNSAYITSIELEYIEKERELRKFLTLNQINSINFFQARKESTKKVTSAVNTTTEIENAVGVFVYKSGSYSLETEYKELKELCLTAGINLVSSVSQRRDTPDLHFYIGNGKIEDIKNEIIKNNAKIVVFNNELVGSKVNNLEKELGVRVIDRSSLILDIFALRAKTNEGKLQVQLAQLKYSLPRLSSYKSSSERFGAGGVGMRGPGETKIELKRRVIDKNIIRIENQLKMVGNSRELRRIKRSNNNQKLVCLVGYTNSGKSTLLNTITKANIESRNQLFTTLDTTTRSVYENGKKFLLTDTVGFISNLPHEFIEAFANTLEETLNADLLLVVVDISNPNYLEQLKTVNEVLTKIGANNIPRIYVYNKIDKLQSNKYKETSDTIYISAKENINIAELKSKIIDKLF